MTSYYGFGLNENLPQETKKYRFDNKQASRNGELPLLTSDDWTDLVFW